MTDSDYDELGCDDVARQDPPQAPLDHPPTLVWGFRNESCRINLQQLKTCQKLFFIQLSSKETPDKCVLVGGNGTKSLLITRSFPSYQKCINE